ncbi:hypothetical protein cce_2269 [Crocosphaera subtropica ATCC 51142]|uniref:Glycosyl transferase n=1 Tax=Crocosphaera subtropica (strain ATCC 51142 / BH68) TaxID=43989 RepID=B1WPP9_CROS5|nr:hypothetical protein [Crocosphaera subtropica]ACB51619.1 hypothetical protein cce_2269 [Crocosphaera subtropica ATCC 51142]
MSQIEEKLKAKTCFGTLALGENYRSLAKLLSKDIEQYSPSTPMVILTDKPQEFSDFSNVLAFKHKQQSVGCYHDKRCVIAKGLSLFDACIFLDADIRILAPIEQTLEWSPGITAHIVWTNILKHNKNQYQLNLLSKMAQKLTLNLEEISFVHEAIFVVAKDSGKELDFLNQWDKIAPYFELNGFYRGEGHTIGLAAAKAGLNIKRESLETLNFFKDKLEIQKIKRGQTSSEQIEEILNIQKQNEYPYETLDKKVLKKLNKILNRIYCTIILRYKTIKNFKFYYL